ncbi:type 11 methyltransferase [Trypanosoma rangeli]|uniref:Type 11 methyltransferase n=1 Tax=Trypanosoma rangeli TaxID=5698 RepID=A0A422N7I7_TRYRA|nr:type 11 methyltransferase [Trypanosoma rangeli]RNF01402.1 type 11 methyltransferase [Trypanosoma rangeli]|eukprot:RNF01402.1 type 11 methyltransferase [Trypanosoma rangeli]
MSLLLRLQSCKYLKSTLYDWMVEPVADMWYREVLLLCPMDAFVLDVGVGGASSLIANRDIIRSKGLNVTGVVCDAEYARTAQDDILKYELENQVNIVYSSILEYTPPHVALIYFSGGFTLIPNKVDMIKRCCRMLQGPAANGSSCTGNAEDDDSGALVFTPTFEKPTLWGPYVLPLLRRVLKLLTTMDFGEATSEADFLSLLRQSELRVVSMRTLKDYWFCKHVMVVARPLK